MASQTELDLRFKREELSDKQAKEIASTKEFKEWKKNHLATSSERWFDAASRLSTGLTENAIGAFNSLSDIQKTAEEQALPKFLQTKPKDTKAKQAFNIMSEAISEEQDRAEKAVLQRARSSQLQPEGYAPSMAEDIGTSLIASYPTFKVGSMPSTNKLMSSANRLFSKEGALAVAKDSALNTPKLGAAELALWNAYGVPQDEAMMNAMMASGVGLLGTPLVAGAKGGFRALDDAVRLTPEEMGQYAGGGTPREDVIKMFEKQKDRNRVAGLTDNIEAKKLDEIDETPETRLDSEINQIKIKMDRLEYDPYREVIEANPSTFKGISNPKARKLLDDNPKMAEQLKNELEQDLFKQLDELDLAKHGDDRVKPKAEEEKPTLASEEEARWRAEWEANDRAKFKREAQEKIDAEVAGRKSDYESRKLEFEEALDRYKKAIDIDEKSFAKAELDKYLKAAEPVDTGIARGIDETLDPFQNEIAQTVSKTDLDIPVPPQKDTVPKGSFQYKQREAKIAKQREWNKNYLEKDYEYKKLENGKDIDPEEMALLEAERGYKPEDYKKPEWFTEREFARMKPTVAKAVKKMIEDANNFKILTKSQKKKLVEMKDELRGKKKYDGHKNKYLKNKHPQREKMKDSSSESSDIGAKESDTLAKQTDVKSKKLETKKYDQDSADDIAEQDRLHDEQLAREADEAFPTSRPKPKEQSKKLVEDELEKEFAKQEETFKKIEDDINVEVKVTDDFLSDFKNLSSDFNTANAAKSFRKLFKASKKVFDSASRYRDVVVNGVHKMTKDMPNGGKDFRKKMFKHLLQTDYESIKDIHTQAQGKAYINANRAVYEQAKREILLLAKSMKDSSAMNNVHWRGNGFAITEKLGMEAKHADTIEKMASIMSMTKADWNFVDLHRGKPVFNHAMDLMRNRTELSNKLFANNPYNKIKGYNAELLENLPNEFTYKRGALPPEMQTKVKGETTLKPKGLSDEAIYELAEAEGMGIVLDAIGKPKLLRKVADEAYKVNQLGKSYDFGEVIGETLGASIRKNGVNTHFNNKFREVIMNKDNNLFNGKGDDFVELTPAEQAMIPKEFRDVIKTVHKDYKQMTIGNMEVHVKTANQSLITAQLMAKDLVRMFKENVVLKNPTSYVNNFAFNYAIGLQNGISLPKMAKYQKEAMAQYTQMRSLQEKLIKFTIANKDKFVDGKWVDKKYGETLYELHNLDLYKMHSEGLAMSVLADITSAPSYSTRLTDKALKKLLTNMFAGKMSPEKIDTMASVASNMYLNPNSRVGKYLLDTFTKIDVFGRYGIAKDAMSKGASITDAVNKSNGIFGDLDKLSPMWVQALSESGAIPFANWFYRVSGGLGKNIKDNAGKAVGIGLALYAVQEITGKRTESFNPMQTMINSPFDMATLSPYLNASKLPETLAVPIGYKKLASGDPSKLVISNSF